MGCEANRDSANASAGRDGLVVHEELVLPDVVDVHDVALAELVEHHTAVAVLAEADRFAVVQLDEHLGARFLRGDAFEGTVVEDVAVLVDLEERPTLVLVRAPERLEHVLAVHVVGARDERRFAASATEIGLNGVSSEPNGDDFVILPTSLVGEY